MQWSIGWRKGAALLCAISPCASAFGQNGGTPGAPTREQIERAAPGPIGDAPSRLTVTGGPGGAPCPLADPALARTTIALKGATFDHLRGLAPEALRPAYEDLVGRTVPLAALCEIRDAAAAILRRAGYIAAVQVPPQQAADGIVRFDVVMARLVRLEVNGRSGKPARRLAAYLAKLVAQPVFSQREAERYLLLARDLPGYDVHLTLRSAETAPGEVIGEVETTRAPFALDAGVQNEGSHAIGRWGGLVTAQINDALGFGDRLTLGLFNSLQPREQTVLQGGYDARLGGEGAVLSGRLTFAHTRPAIGDGDLLRSRTLVGTVEAGYPLVRSQAANLRAAAGFDLVDQDLRLDGVPYTRDRLRAAFVRIDADAIDRRGTGWTRWRVAGTLEARRGLGLLGASRGCGPASLDAACYRRIPPSRIEGDPTATILRFTGYGEWRLARGLAVVASPRAQYAFDPLLSYEQFSGGAYTIGRGYDPGAVIGDSGAGISLEAQFGTLAPGTRSSIALQPFTFVDAAWTWNRNSVIAENDPLRIISTGGGVRATWGGRTRIELTAARPLRRTPDQARRGATRALLSITTRLGR